VAPSYGYGYRGYDRYGYYDGASTLRIISGLPFSARGRRDREGGKPLFGAASFLQPREPVESALQDESGGVLVDNRSTLAAADVGRDQLPLYRSGR